jgi:hypothetical protein
MRCIIAYHQPYCCAIARPAKIVLLGIRSRRPCLIVCGSGRVHRQALLSQMLGSSAGIIQVRGPSGPDSIGMSETRSDIVKPIGDSPR